MYEEEINKKIERLKEQNNYVIELAELDEFRCQETIYLDQDGKVKNNQKCYVLARLVIGLYKNLYYCDDWTCFFIWEDRYYTHYTDKEFKRALAKVLIQNFGQYINWDINDQYLKELVKTIKVHMPSDRFIEEDDLAFNLTSFINGTYNGVTGELQESTPDNLCFIYTNHKYENIESDDQLKELAPYYYKFLQTTFGYADPDTRIITPEPTLIRLMEELLGATFVRSYKDLAKAVFLVGDSDNGKSILTKLLLSIFPKKFSLSSSLEILTTDKHGKASLKGKILNICSEDESKRLSSDAFKALVTEDQIHGEKKYQDDMTFVNRAKLIFASNDAPTFPSMEKAIEKRLVVIPFNGKFLKGDKHRIDGLDDKLKNEIPYIIGSWLKALRILLENNGNYTQSELARHSFEKLREAANNAEIFIASDWVKIELENDFPSKIQDIFNHYRSYCDSCNMKPSSKHKFCRDINKNPYVKKAKGIAKYNITLLSEEDRELVEKEEEELTPFD